MVRSQKQGRQSLRATAAYQSGGHGTQLLHFRNAFGHAEIRKQVPMTPALRNS